MDDKEGIGIEMKEDFGNRLRLALKVKRMTQQELSERTGITKGAISEYCNGKYLPKFENLSKICIALDIKMESLMGIKKDSQDQKQ